MTQMIALAAAGFVGCAVALGDPIPNAGPTADVRQKIAQADAAIATGGQSLQDLATQLGQQADAIADLSKRFAQQAAAQKALGPLVEQAAKQATADVDVARRDFTARDLAVRDATNAIATARADLSKRMADAQRAAGDERKTFAASPDRARLDAAFTSARASLDRATADVDAQLGNDVRYAKLAAETARLEKDVRARRDAKPVDADALADASAAWIAAKNGSESARRDVLARSAPFDAATDALAKAKADVDAADAAFERSILTRPGVAEAQLAVLAASDAIKAGEDRLAVAKQEQARSAQAFAQRKASAETLVKLNRDADASLADLQQDVKRAQASVSAIAKLLASRASDVTDVRGALRDAIALCRKVDVNVGASTKKP